MSVTKTLAYGLSLRWSMGASATNPGVQKIGPFRVSRYTCRTVNCHSYIKFDRALCIHRLLINFGVWQ
jgi:hypothetical protein